MHCLSFNHLLSLQPVMYLFFGSAVFLPPPDQIIHGAPKGESFLIEEKHVFKLRTVRSRFIIRQYAAPKESAGEKHCVTTSVWFCTERHAITYTVNPCLPRVRKVPSYWILNSISVLFRPFVPSGQATVIGGCQEIEWRSAPTVTYGDLHSPVSYNIKTKLVFRCPLHWFWLPMFVMHFNFYQQMVDHMFNELHMKARLIVGGDTSVLRVRTYLCTFLQRVQLNCFLNRGLHKLLLPQFYST